MALGNRLAHVRFLVTQGLYDLRRGLWARPLSWALVVGSAGLWLPAIEARPGVAAALRSWLGGLSAGEPSAAQLQLSTIASAMMTTVSVVYSVLVVALTLASVQFSPRILSHFLSSRASQDTIGCFIGTFVYCLLALRSVRTAPEPFVPALALFVALVLVLVSLGLLIYTLHHLASSIQANHIVQRIATETLDVIDAQFTSAPVADPPPELPTRAEAVAIPSPSAGYLQLVGEEELVDIARVAGLQLWVELREGQFVVSGEPLLWLAPAARHTPELEATLQAAVDLGPDRTLQRDVEFGVRQIVDIALKAISPAVNDPSTACTCIDHLSELLCQTLRRHSASPWALTPQGEAAVWIRRAQPIEVVDLALNQLRQYGAGDVAVSLRLAKLLRACERLATAPRIRDQLRHHARLLAGECGKRWLADELTELHRRLAPLLDER
jgi:uncharacterized membrane protein